MHSNHAFARSLARPLTKFESLIFCNSRVMSLGGGPPPKSLDSFGLPVPNGGGSTSVPASCHPFKVSLMAVITEISLAHGYKNSTSSNSDEVIHGPTLIPQHSKRSKTIQSSEKLKSAL
jgi:hypothetical protein